MNVLQLFVIFLSGIFSLYGLTVVILNFTGKINDIVSEGDTVHKEKSGLIFHIVVFLINLVILLVALLVDNLDVHIALIVIFSVLNFVPFVFMLVLIRNLVTYCCR